MGASQAHELSSLFRYGKAIETFFPCFPIGQLCAQAALSEVSPVVEPNLPIGQSPEQPISTAAASELSHMHKFVLLQNPVLLCAKLNFKPAEV
jgi:hypothetical protein